jgi:hypothetical protein
MRLPAAIPEIRRPWVSRGSSFSGRYAALVHEAPFDGRLAGKEFAGDQNQFPLARFFILDAMASRAIGDGVALFSAVRNCR